jgi:hypothetical protein
VRTEQRREDVLRRRLPHRAGDRNDTRAAPRTHCCTDRCERSERLGRYERRCRTARASVVEECVAATERDEEIAGRDTPRVDLDPGDNLGVALEQAKAAELSKR